MCDATSEGSDRSQFHQRWQLWRLAGAPSRCHGAKRANVLARVQDRLRYTRRTHQRDIFRGLCLSGPERPELFSQAALGWRFIWDSLWPSRIRMERRRFSARIGLHLQIPTAGGDYRNRESQHQTVHLGDNEMTPNHALQRTAPAVTLAASAAALPPAMQPARQPPQSLSLGSLGDSAHLQ